MPLISGNNSESLNAVRTPFRYQQSDPSDSSTMLMKSLSSPELLLKSASEDNFLVHSTYKDKACKSDDGDTTSYTSRSFEFREDPSFWKDHNVQVIIRTRPLSGSEISLQGHNRCVRQDSSQSITWTGQPESRFTFDLVADENVSQEMLFKVAGVPMVENCVGGYNSCMFAYGQTGSGKTHTMLGDIEGGTRRHSVNCGMTPRVFEYLFSRIQKEKEARREEKIKFTCKCSFLEIYNEQILDLLDPSSVNLQIREDTKKGIYVENLNEVEVTSARDVIQQLIQGSANRKVAATNMNRASSRSHSVFTCIIESKWESQGITHHRFARLNLVDLAGSERQKSSGAEGERLKEATNINKSLSTLGLVIMNLVNISNGKSLHVPYRDSKLTFLLQDSLGGNAKTIIIANISPSICCSLETLSTLKFAQRAKFIKNHAIINEDASGDVLALRMENQNLKKEVSRLRSLVSGGAEGNDADILSVTFPGSPGSFKWERLNGFSSPLISDKKMSHLQKKEFEVALVGAFRREKDKDIALQTLTAENQAAMQLAKQREDEIQGLKMRLRFRESGIKRLEAVASGKISAETHLLKEKEEHLKEIEVLRTQVDRNQEVTRFAMENLRLKEEIRRLKSFYEEGERERMNEQIMILQNKLLEALDWKLMHESDASNAQDSASPWRTSINEENEFLHMQAIQNESELNSLRKKLDFCVEEKGKLERHVKDLVEKLEAERMSHEAKAEDTRKGQTELLSLTNNQMLNIGECEQMEIKTMVDAIAAASQREAEAHEMAIVLSKENDELKMKLRVLIEDNNKLIELYEGAVADNRKNTDESLNPQEDEAKNNIHHREEKELDMKKVVESLEHQLMEMHEENDKLLGLYEKAMQERDEFKRVLASGQQKNDNNKGEFNCPGKLVEIDEGRCLRYDESPGYEDDKYEREETGSTGPCVQNVDRELVLEDQPESSTEELLDETCLYEVNVQDDYGLCLNDSEISNYSDSSEAGRQCLLEVTENSEARPFEEERIETDELMKLEKLEESNIRQKTSLLELNATEVSGTAGCNMEIQAKSSTTILVNVYKDLESLRKKLAEAQEKLSDSAQTIRIFGSLERAILDVDVLSGEIEKMEKDIQDKQKCHASLKLLSSQIQERRDQLDKKLSALKYSLASFSSSVSYFDQRETSASSRLNASVCHLNQRKMELAHLHVSRKEIMDAQMKIKQSEFESKNCLEDLKSQMEEENRRLESERVLFAIDNVEKTAIDLSQKNWQLSGKATELLKSEEEKTKLQNQIKQTREKLGDLKREGEALNKKLGKVESDIQVLEMEVKKDMQFVQEMDHKLQQIIEEKKMLLEINDEGRNEFESMIIEYHQSMFEGELKEEEMKIVDEELQMELQKIGDLQKAKAEATKRKTHLLEVMSCSNSCFSDKVEEDFHSIRVSIMELNSLLDQ
ncbi:kinesin-like protein KIN-12E isoform X2 [Olea europaea var. sylvestris]|uniref:kinesin-like protein KIN-12E isoform X1 n=1 Tax=Olea europaea var. sylvestris TaxID=158386 RepID=UPI000C1D0E98|nr:kinesin-like protein KIN-12E isoform X1 [Olea europaea var. sylvestris]XP_022869346.1 kinesin-like protein KIN-12E isoform X2 [Olea europaea var. sylvestris]